MVSAPYSIYQGKNMGQGEENHQEGNNDEELIRQLDCDKAKEGNVLGKRENTIKIGEVRSVFKSGMNVKLRCGF